MRPSADRARRPRHGDGEITRANRNFMIETLAGMNRGAARRRPLAMLQVGDAYGVTVSVCTTCVVPGVTSDVMAATDL